MIDSTLVSIIVPTYNRAGTICRALDSAFAQTYQNIEVILVDDGSTDETEALLKKYTDPRMRIVRHEVNKGVTAAKNTGLDNVKGEWFTILDSDDEMVPDAISLMLAIPGKIDPTINAVTCNCMDTASGILGGIGLDKDQYLDFEKIVLQCKGEFWGVTSTGLLQKDRFNERVPGTEATLWFKINERANRYYLHKALRLFHSDGNDRVTKAVHSLRKKSDSFLALLEESHYWDTLKKYQASRYAHQCLRASVILKADRKPFESGIYYKKLKKVRGFFRLKFIGFLVQCCPASFIDMLLKKNSLVKSS